MNNAEFKKQYGIKSFNDLSDIVNNNLVYYKYQKKISGYKISNRKGIVTIYYKKQQFKFELAKIYDKDINVIINRMEEIILKRKEINKEKVGV